MVYLILNLKQKFDSDFTEFYAYKIRVAFELWLNILGMMLLAQLSSIQEIIIPGKILRYEFT